MRTSVIATIAVLASSLAASAQDAPYSSDDIVKFLADEALKGAKTRGLCIGTAQECAPPEPKGMDMLITFELDSSELTQQAKENLAIFAQALTDERLSRARFVVEGHTDGRGNEVYNLGLSKSRAASVKEYLTELGVPIERLTAIGLGENEPRTGDVLDPENRRVELRIDLQ